MGITLESEKIITNINHMNKPENTIERYITTLKRKFTKRFIENQTVKNIEVDIQLKEGAKLIQQEGEPIPVPLQPGVEKRIDKLKIQGHIEKAKSIDKNCFLSTADITIKNTTLSNSSCAHEN